MDVYSDSDSAGLTNKNKAPKRAILNSLDEKQPTTISALVNIFNPELIVLGGVLAQTGDYIRLPIMISLNKYSISLANKDAKLKMSVLGKDAGVLGACLIARNKVLSF